MERIEVNPGICGGKPVIRGTRIMVRKVLGMVAGGYSVDRILESYEELTREDSTRHSSTQHAWSTRSR